MSHTGSRAAPGAAGDAASSHAKGDSGSGSNSETGGMLIGRGTMPIGDVIPGARYPPEWPFTPEHFRREDEAPDSVFYTMPRFVKHIDDAAVYSLRLYYEAAFVAASKDETLDCLDLCSSWLSHYPSLGEHGRDYGRVVGVGMNELELERNEVLTEHVVQDLNVDPVLPFERDSFDVVTSAVSVDYLTRPRDVFNEILRVLRHVTENMIVARCSRCSQQVARVHITLARHVSHRCRHNSLAADPAAASTLPFQIGVSPPRRLRSGEQARTQTTCGLLVRCFTSRHFPAGGSPTLAQMIARPRQGRLIRCTWCMP